MGGKSESCLVTDVKQGNRTLPSVSVLLYLEAGIEDSAGPGKQERK